MPVREQLLPSREVAALETAVHALLATGAIGPLKLIGAGEITCVLAWQGQACKRLPPATSVARLHRHRAHIYEYVTALEAAGIHVIETAVQIVDRSAYGIGYVVQPELPGQALLPSVMAAASPASACALAAQVFAAVERATGRGLGLDANLSNWAIRDGRLLYIDVSTPMMRDAAGRHRLDSDLFLSTLPAMFRVLVRRWLLSGVLDRYYIPRAVFEHLLCELPNIGLAELAEAVLSEANSRLTPPLTREDVAAYRRQARITWALMRGGPRLARLWRCRVATGIPPHLVPSSFGAC